MSIDHLLGKIHNVDCLPFMRSLPDKCVDLVLTDPPYGIDIGKMGFVTNRDGGVAVRTDYKGQGRWDKSRPSPEVFDQIFRISKHQIIFGGNYFSDILPPTKSWIVWDKRTDEKYNNDFADGEVAWTSFNKPLKIYRHLWSGMLQQDMKNKEERVHPTQKPMAILSKIIRDWAEAGQIIFDPYIGSGTTALSAERFWCKWFGCELEPKYVAIANKRIEAERNQLKLF